MKPAPSPNSPAAHRSFVVPHRKTWSAEDAQEGQTSLTVSFKAKGVSSSYEALRDGKKLKLWTYVGDPDDSHSLCILTAPAG
ncbi:hypothetical protein ACGFWI_02745 [Streptomyces sp. NPDC048434]|uniref:hypothetical protein n=1 Tax=Streptomyces sp. NPDC048434 TaxID=3365549 RepID=UPI003722135C